MMYLDLDELPTLFHRYWLWSYNKANIAWFDRRQHSGPADTDLTHWVRLQVEAATGSYPTGPIRLLTHLRYFGYGFNPVSFFYCFDDDGETLKAIVAEITNTPWKEQHCYVLPVTDPGSHRCHFRFDKEFHVSPFNAMNQEYRWFLSLPSRRLAVHMDVFQDGHRHFDATLHLQQMALNSQSLRRVLLKFPFMTARIITAIYFQAFKLWLKKTPFYHHPAKQADAYAANKSPRKAK